MAHHEEHTEHLSHEELKYREHMKRAADLCKIDLFLTARSEFLLALQYKPGDQEAAAKAEECSANIRRDRKKVLVLVPIVIAVIIAVILFA
jgi:hypothetical protein